MLRGDFLLDNDLLHEITSKEVPKKNLNLIESEVLGRQCSQQIHAVDTFHSKEDQLFSKQDILVFSNHRKEDRTYCKHYFDCSIKYPYKDNLQTLMAQKLPTIELIVTRSAQEIVEGNVRAVGRPR